MESYDRAVFMWNHMSETSGRVQLAEAHYVPSRSSSARRAGCDSKMCAIDGTIDCSRKWACLGGSCTDISDMLGVASVYFVRLRE
jgi:hypothetical protein